MKSRLQKKLKKVPDRLRQVSRNTRRKIKKTLRKPVRTFSRWGKMEVSHLLLTLIKFLHFQIRIRPRIRLVSIVMLILMLALIGTNKAVDVLRAKEPEIKINGQSILVADQSTIANHEETELEGHILAKKSPFDFKKPVNGYTSQGYSTYHRAIDIATGAVGVPIKPLGSGRVEFAGFLQDGKGNVVMIDHGDGLKSLYAHMGRITVGVGNQVDSGTVLGTVGLTGRTTGAHLHVELYDNNISVDPAKILPE